MKMKENPEHPANLDALIKNFDCALSHPDSDDPVSYTHLDVYKRQPPLSGPFRSMIPLSFNSDIYLAIVLSVTPVSYTHLIPNPLSTSFSVARMYGSLAPFQSKEVFNTASAKSP